MCSPFRYLLLRKQSSLSLYKQKHCWFYPLRSILIMLYCQFHALSNKHEIVNAISFLWESCKSICPEDKFKKPNIQAGLRWKHIYNITLDIYIRHCKGLVNVKLLYSSLSKITYLLLLRVITLFGRVFQNMFLLPSYVWETIWVLKGERAVRPLSRNSEVTCSLGNAAERVKGGGGAGRE